MDEATKKHVGELVAMPFRTFLDVRLMEGRCRGRLLRGCLAEMPCAPVRYAEGQVP